MTKAIRKAAQATMAIRIRPELVMEAQAKGSKPSALHLEFKVSGRKVRLPFFVFNRARGTIEIKSLRTGFCFRKLALPHTWGLTLPPHFEI
jgi:hypothetical protein